MNLFYRHIMETHMTFRDLGSTSMGTRKVEHVRSGVVCWIPVAALVRTTEKDALSVLR